jgi:hypothetical protein
MSELAEGRSFPHRMLFLKAGSQIILRKGHVSQKTRPKFIPLPISFSENRNNR